MEIKIAKICGLCAGCKLAIQTTFSALKEKKNVILFKELVHNDRVNKMLCEKGAVLKNNLNELSPNETIILRAHGERPETYKYLKEHHIDYIDCTCPRVKQIHELAKYYSEQNFVVILIGKNNHPEVVGTLGYITNKYFLVSDKQDVKKLRFNKKDKVCILCQTTFNEKKAYDLIKLIQNLCKQNEFIFKNTICPAQKQIHVSSLALAKECDLMIVIGNENSSNTQELFNDLKKVKKSIFVHEIKNWKNCLLKENIKLNKNIKIGITAGASNLKDELFELKEMILKDSVD